MIASDKFEKAITTFDAYNLNDPHQEEFEGKMVSKELLYAQRMSQRLDDFYPAAPEYLKLAAHCQHIGRWEIPRESYPMDKKRIPTVAECLEDAPCKTCRTNSAELPLR